jgi:hypothetical protein
MARKQGIAVIPVERIESRIFLVRGLKVMLDMDLAEVYGVATKRLNQQVRRNIERFPQDFMFELSNEEVTNLRLQIATANWAMRRSAPLAFTEHGALMVASVLNTPRAIQTSIEVVRAFQRLREMLANHAELRRKLLAMERKYDSQFQEVFEAIRELSAPPPPTKKHKLGF